MDVWTRAQWRGYMAISVLIQVSLAEVLGALGAVPAGFRESTLGKLLSQSGKMPTPILRKSWLFYKMKRRKPLQHLSVLPSLYLHSHTQKHVNVWCVFNGTNRSITSSTNIWLFILPSKVKSMSGMPSRVQFIITQNCNPIFHICILYTSNTLLWI